MRIISNPKEFNCWTPETYKAFEKTITIHIVVPMVVVNLLIVGVIFTTRHYTVTVVVKFMKRSRLSFNVVMVAEDEFGERDLLIAVSVQSAEFSMGCRDFTARILIYCYC